jgi:hypothetical protein
MPAGPSPTADRTRHPDRRHVRRDKCVGDLRPAQRAAAPAGRRRDERLDVYRKTERREAIADLTNALFTASQLVRNSSSRGSQDRRSYASK